MDFSYLVCAQPKPFRFMQIPQQRLQWTILDLACRLSPQTFCALSLVSQRMRELVQPCAPEKVTLSRKDQVVSFRYACQSPAFAYRILQLWIIADTSSRVEGEVTSEILRACTRLCVLHCRPTPLIVGICSSHSLHHIFLRDLTIVETNIPWDDIAASPCGLHLLSRLTHLRIVNNVCAGDLDYIARMNSLQFLCLPHPSPELEERFRALLLERPFIKLLVVFLNYYVWRDGPIPALPELEGTNRALVCYCVKKWKEIQVWKDGGFWHELGRRRWHRPSVIHPMPQQGWTVIR